MPEIPNTSGRLHSEFIILLFLQDHRETDRFFEASGVHRANEIIQFDESIDEPVVKPNQNVLKSYLRHTHNRLSLLSIHYNNVQL